MHPARHALHAGFGMPLGNVLSKRRGFFDISVVYVRGYNLPKTRPSKRYYHKSVQSSNLRDAFDNNKHWDEFSCSASFLPATGLFDNPYLKDPQGLRTFGQESLVKAKSILNAIRNDDTQQGKLLYIVRLDKLSDTLCRVIDLCEFVRSTHPSEAFVKAAQECHEEMFEFMNVLNTDVKLCNLLKEVLSNENICLQLTEEELRVGNLLLDDFEKSGIYMNPEVREKFIAISQAISLIGQEFINNTDEVDSTYVSVNCAKMNKSGIPPSILESLKKDLSRRNYKIPIYSEAAFKLIKTCSDSDIRRIIWKAHHCCSKDQIDRLTKLIQLRTALAALLGKKSFSDYQLEGKMAKCPENVKQFVNEVMRVTKPKVVKELSAIAKLIKSEDIRDSTKSDLNQSEILEIVKPWDRDYYLEKINNSKTKAERTILSSILPYFTLGNVMDGLSVLFDNIYGIRLKSVAPKPGETWTNDVRKIEVVSEEDGLIGIIYCDLYERAGKNASAAHFTICCSHQIYSEEQDYSTIQTGVDRLGNKFQLPVISLVCNFPKNSQLLDQGPICVLTLNEVETLFHEMGHAMHSMLGRTKLQNVSGTRCATDFVELPSILMEHFARDSRVLENIGRHYRTGEKVPSELVQRYLDVSKNMQQSEIYSQAKMAMLDQEFYGLEYDKNLHNLNVVELYHSLESRMEVLPDTQSSWCGKFGHLFGYGATYYSYLFDRAIASKVWETLFQNDPYSRESGQKFKDCVLKWGGQRDPWLCISDVLGNTQLKSGGIEAMRFIANTQKI